MSKTNFINLRVYQLSEILADEIWIIVNSWKYFEKETVGKQLVKAADSVGANTRPVKQLELSVYYTYILQCIPYMDFYTGSTKDLKLRFE